MWLVPFHENIQFELFIMESVGQMERDCTLNNGWIIRSNAAHWEQTITECSGVEFSDDATGVPSKRGNSTHYTIVWVHCIGYAFSRAACVYSLEEVSGKTSDIKSRMANVSVEEAVHCQVICHLNCCYNVRIDDAESQECRGQTASMFVLHILMIVDSRRLHVLVQPRNPWFYGLDLFGRSVRAAWKWEVHGRTFPSGAIWSDCI